MDDEPVMPLVHAEVEAIPLAVVDDFHADDLAGELLPGLAVLDADAEVSELRSIPSLRLP